MTPRKLVSWPHAEWTRKTFQQTVLRGSIVMLSVGNPSAAGTQRRQALQECPVMLAGTTARGINRKWWSVAARLDTAAFLTWRDCPWLVRRWCAAAMAIVKVFVGVRGSFYRKRPREKTPYIWSHPGGTPLRYASLP